MRIPVLSSVLLAGLLVAGCASDAPDDDPGTPGPTLPQAIVSWARVGATTTVEPTLGVTQDGVVLVVAGEDTFRSLDAGQSWDLVDSLALAQTPVGQQPNTFDPWLWVDPMTDRVYVDHMWPILTCTLLTTSDDDGASWSPKRPACPSAPVDFQKLVTGPPGPEENALAGVAYPSVAYLCFNKPVYDVAVGLPVGRFGLSCSASYDGGIAWTNEQVLSGAIDVNGIVVGDCYGGAWYPAVAPDGAVVIRSQPDCLFRSRDSGMSWQPIGTGPAEFEGTQLAFDAAGTLYGLSGGWEPPLRIATSSDQGATWGAAIEIPLPVASFYFETFVAAGPGRIGLAFYGTQDTTITEQTAWTPWLGWLTWNGTGFETDLREVTAEPLHVGCVERGPDCVFLGDFMRAALGPDGSLWAVYVDDATEQGRYDALVARLGPAP